MAEVAFRPYREADRADVARVWFDASLSSIPGEPMPPDLHKTLFERIPNELAAGWTLVVATENDKVVGMLAYFSEARHLDQLFIDPACQCRGVGKALLDRTKAAMPGGFWLRTMARNHNARRFYEREGLRHKGDAPHPRHPEVMFSTYEWELG